MNAEAQQLPASYQSPSTSALVLDAQNMNLVMTMAEMMAKGTVTVPEHLQKKPADCMAVVMQAMQWGMHPFAIAQKTHVTQSGQLGYEAQLINAVATSCGALRTQPEFTFFGDWKRILGKVKEQTNDKGKKYYVPGWDKSAEDGLGVICSAVLRGESKPREIEVLLAQCYPRFSTGWATDPQQQITYAAVRKFIRRYAPAAILGVYTPEELDGDEPPLRIEPNARTDIPPGYSDADFTKNFPTWEKAIQAGKKTADDIIATVSTKGVLSDEQRNKIKAVKRADSGQPQQTENTQNGEPQQ